MICTHCGADMFTCRGYLTLASAPGTLPLVYACHPSCDGFPRAQGVLIPTVPPARSPWRDRHTDPPPTRDDTPILVVEEGADPAGHWHQTAVVLYWHAYDEEWVDTGCEPRCWAWWQPVELPPVLRRQDVG